MVTDSRLVAFVYVLLADAFPVSEVEALIAAIDLLEGTGDGYELPNDLVGELARELALTIGRLQ